MLLTELFSQLDEANYATVYYNPRTGEYANVIKRPDGSYYGDTGDYDFVAQNEQELLHKLKSWGFRTDPVGAEKVQFEAAGVGVVAANKKMANDPRYSMSQTVDIGPGETQKQAAKFGNKTDKMGNPPRLRADGKVTEASAADDITHAFGTLYNAVNTNLQRVALLAMQGRQNEAMSQLRSVIKDASPEVQKKIIDAVNNIKPVTINGKVADSSTLDKSQQHVEWIQKTFIPWVQSLLGKNESVTEAAMSTTIQGRMPVSAGARGLMGARWRYDTIVKDSESKNLDNATALLANRLKDLDQGLDYDSIDKTMRSICEQHHIMPKELHDAFISRYNLTPDRYAAKMRHERKNKPKAV